MSRRLYVIFLLMVLSLASLSAQVETRNLDELNKQQPNTFALVVGVSDYQSDKIRDLNYAELDARAFASYLKSKSGGQVPAENIIELYGKDANSTNIWQRGIGYYFFYKNKFKRGDRLILYFSGHGGSFNSAEKDNAYFFVYDALHATDGDANLKISQIKDLINTLSQDGVQVIFIFDACRSADVGVKGGVARVNEIVEKSQGEVLLTASKGGKVAYESNKIGHGIFTYFLIRSLFGDADTDPKDGKIKGYELDAYLKSNVRSFSSSEFQEEQLPYMSWGNSNELEESVLFTYDQQEGKMAIASLELKRDTEKSSPLVAQRGASKSVVSPAEEYKSLFDKAMSDGKIIRPSNDCAYYYFSKLRGIKGSEDVLEKLRFPLAAKLMDMARAVINDDLMFRNTYVTALDNSITGGSDYYSRPVEAMAKYSAVSPPEAVHPSASSMRIYLQARLAVIDAVSTEEKQAIMAKLDEEIKANPGKSYLYFAKGMLLKSMGKAQEAAAFFRLATKTSPLWTRPSAIEKEDLKEEH